MTLQQAVALVKKRGVKASTVHVTSDNSIYYSCNLSELKDHAKKAKLKLFEVMPEQKEIILNSKKEEENGTK